MVTVKTKTPNLDRIEKEMKYLSTHGVKVGVLGDVSNEESTKVKEYAVYLILGTSTMEARDFMTHAIRGRNQRLKVTRMQRTLLRKVFRGELTGKQCLEQLGIFGVQLIQASIMSNDFAPLKASTIIAKKRNKYNQLRDSDTLLNSIAFEVVRL